MYSIEKIARDSVKQLAYVNSLIEQYQKEEEIKEHSAERCKKYVKRLLKVRDAIKQVSMTTFDVISFTHDSH